MTVGRNARASSGVICAYAMMMKHMSDTAFSKVIYDSSRIPEWTNEVGEAIAAMGGGNISDAVSVIGTGEMQDGFCELIDSGEPKAALLHGVTGSGKTATLTKRIIASLLDE